MIGTAFYPAKSLLRNLRNEAALNLLRRVEWPLYATALVVIEVGPHSRWASALVAGLGHEVLVANAGRVPLIHQSNRKNDRLDARHLAKLARLDPSLLAPTTHRDGMAQAQLSLIRARDALVRARTALINCVRGLVKPTGLQLPACASAATNQAHQQNKKCKDLVEVYAAFLSQPAICIRRDLHRLLYPHFDQQPIHGIRR